jgi:DNA primase
MTGPRYTPQHLFTLRNHIPIDRLIETISVPSKIQEGRYRFQCPICNEFNTGINPKTNLARCFSCQKNFNTIDFVMTVKGASFIDSVAYLETLTTAFQFSIQLSQSSASAPNHSRDVHKANTPLPVGDILKSMAIPVPLESSLPTKDEPQTIATLQKRLSALERLVKSLTEKIALIELRQMKF